MGFIIPLMDAEHAGACTRQIMHTVIREFDTPEDEMKRIVLKVLKQCVSTEGVTANYVRDTIINDYFRCFWIRRIALDKKSAKQVVETTVEIAKKVGGGEVVSRIVDHLKDESEPYRKTVMETIEKIIISLGVADINSKVEEKLMDGMLFAFQEHTSDDSAVIINGFGTIVNSLGSRCKVSIPYICGTIQ
jgi:U2 snRNP spliceosome subunit